MLNVQFLLNKQNQFLSDIVFKQGFSQNERNSDFDHLQICSKVVLEIYLKAVRPPRTTPVTNYDHVQVYRLIFHICQMSQKVLARMWPISVNTMRDSCARKQTIYQLFLRSI